MTDTPSERGRRGSGPMADRDEHIVTFSKTGYGLQHPIRCRPDLIGCIFKEWLATQLAPDKKPGRYVMTWFDPENDDGPRYSVEES